MPASPWVCCEANLLTGRLPPCRSPPEDWAQMPPTVGEGVVLFGELGLVTFCDCRAHCE